MRLQALRRAAAFLALPLALAACDKTQDLQVGRLVGGATVQVRDVEPVGGFLPSPNLLEPGGQGAAALVYRNTGVNMARYNAVILDPVAIWTGPDSPVASLPRQQRLTLANTFTSDLATALRGGGCKVVRNPAPGAIRLRIALVDATASRPALNTVANYAPYVSAAYAVGSRRLNKGAGYFAGSAQIEGYATDASNGALLWQAVDKRAGTSSMLENTLDTQLDIHHAFQDWAKKGVERLKFLGICGGGQGA